MTDPTEDLIEDIIHGLPLKSVSESCDQEVLAAIRMPSELCPSELCPSELCQSELCPSVSNDIGDQRESLVGTQPIDRSEKSASKTTDSNRGNRRSKFGSIAVAIAASLLIGFIFGMQFNGSQDSNRTELVDGLKNASAVHSNTGTKTLASTDKKMGINPSGVNQIELIENESETFIVSESLHWKNQMPIRRVETITNKKVLVTDNDSEPKRIEVPIRKVIYTLADSI